MKRRILRDMLLLSFMTVALTSILICGVLYRYEFREMKQKVQNQASNISKIMNRGELDIPDPLLEADTNTRITVISHDGEVLFDNWIDADFMENHLDRIEVTSALHNGSGEAIRLSDTLGEQTYYYAIRLENNSLLRVAFTTYTIVAVFLSIVPVVLLISCIVFAVAFIMASRQAQKIVKPINEINLENPVESDIYNELSPLVGRILQLRRHVDMQVAQARENQEQFSLITGNMAEGLVVLDEKGCILSVNTSAIHLLGATIANYTGRQILTLNRSSELQRVIRKVLSGKPVKENIASDGKIIRVLANPVRKDETIRGGILLLLDVTESQNMENFRREFSANVSHELKTPLTVISGSADLMRNNLVKPNDIPAFSEKIYHEAQRLIQLINDIIFISQMDEGTLHMALKKVDLLEAAKRVAQRLQAVAVRKGVSVEVSGSPVNVQAVPGLLDELIQNLCDNAIRYNMDNGKVDITVFQKGSKALLEVKDTGIGIPSAHHERIFERFYRVDKSHSRETGGTGLGLSIVKHVAFYHHAEIKLESAAGHGTTITVLFPAEETGDGSLS